ncbi:hypothetical protein HK098_001415 [Nowakowskiella sp. JEL0407]|nr:hypothetical protein HK098_001415 [Nowakowskiella sp. JEL0407]
MLLPYFLMPLQRRVKGDLIILLECGEKFLITDTTVCGSEDKEYIKRNLDRIDCNAKVRLNVSTRSTLTRQTQFKSVDRERPKLFIRPYRLIATRIDEAGDADDEWTFGVLYHPPQTMFSRIMDLCQGSKDLKSIQDAMNEMGKMTGVSIFGDKKTLKKMKKKYLLFGKFMEQFSNDHMVKFPFHLFVTPRFMKNYKYESVIDVSRPLSIVLKIPTVISALKKEEIIDTTKNLEGTEELFKMMERKLVFELPKISLFVYTDEKTCDRWGLTWKKHKRCSRCLQVRYCSVECQKAHWSVHKSNCSLVANDLFSTFLLFVALVVVVFNELLIFLSF